MRAGSVLLALALAVGGACGGGDDDADPADAASGTSAPADEPPTTTTDTPGNPAFGQYANFDIDVTTGRDAYRPGDQVSFEVTVCNRAESANTEGGGGSDVPFDFDVVDSAGQVVADTSHAVRTGELRMISWSRDECRTVGSTWNQHRWNRPEDQPDREPHVFGNPVMGPRVEPGEYELRVRLWDGPTIPVSIVIEA